jgi:hypothetical protein
MAKVGRWLIETPFGMILSVVAIVGIIFLIIALTTGFGGGGNTATTLNDICRPHHGVNRIDYPFVICRDGFASEY